MGQVTFVREGISISVPDGTTVMEAEIRAGLSPEAPCGGRGGCGKCLVKIGGRVMPACQTPVQGDMTVETSIFDNRPVILTEGENREVPFRPGLRTAKISLEKPDPGDPRADWDRLLDALKKETGADTSELRPDLPLASSLYERRLQAPEWHVVFTEEEILDMQISEPNCHMAAFDIGTTTVAGFLLDGRSGDVCAIESCRNPQAQYGADVIARASYALEHGADSLRDCIRRTLDEMLGALAQKAGISREEIYQVSIVGNTCMQHLLLGISPASLVHAPYTPAFSGRLTMRAADLDLRIAPRGQALLLPSIAGYVGADTCGCLLALRQDQREEITLMIDIGTNGEMVLGNREKLVTCSTAAGPAFEGAKIECGMCGAAGAVDHVFREDGILTYTTIHGKPARGLCGSGLIDLVAELRRAGLVDEMGHLESGQAREDVFVLAPPALSGSDRGVYLTQKDIREVQLAKAAIAAGIALLREELGIGEEEIRTVYIAGAFGNYMDPRSAAAIGLIPPSLRDRVVPVGNAAGEGARIALRNAEEWKLTDRLAREITFVELAASPAFQDRFVEELEFPEEE